MGLVTVSQMEMIQEYSSFQTSDKIRFTAKQKTREELSGEELLSTRVPS